MLELHLITLKNDWIIAVSRYIGWTGPTANIWDDSQCQNLGSYANFGNDLHQCQQACSAITECSAINYNPGHDCVLRGCSKPVPTPSSNWGNYVGYSKTVGMYWIDPLRISKLQN